MNCKPKTLSNHKPWVTHYSAFCTRKVAFGFGGPQGLGLRAKGCGFGAGKGLVYLILQVYSKGTLKTSITLYWEVQF